MSQALHDLMQLDADINFVDTDNVYSAREPEEIVGKALKRRRDDVVLAPSSSCRWAQDRTAAEAPGGGSSSYSGSRIVEAQIASRDRNLA